jgi:hypothetical protein
VHFFLPDKLMSITFQRIHSLYIAYDEYIFKDFEKFESNFLLTRIRDIPEQNVNLLDTAICRTPKSGLYNHVHIFVYIHEYILYMDEAQRISLKLQFVLKQKCLIAAGYLPAFMRVFCISISKTAVILRTSSSHIVTISRSNSPLYRSKLVTTKLNGVWKIVRNTSIESLLDRDPNFFANFAKNEKK